MKANNLKPQVIFCLLFTTALLCFVAMGSGHKGNNDRKLPEPVVNLHDANQDGGDSNNEEPEIFSPEKYIFDEMPQEIIYTRAAPYDTSFFRIPPENMLIDFYNLPIRNKSYNEIVEMFGKPYQVRYETKGRYGVYGNKKPRHVVEACLEHPEDSVFFGLWKYKDGSEDVLLLYYLKFDENPVILKGFRINGQYAREIR